MLIQTKGSTEYKKLLHFGEQYNNALDIVCASALAFSPILQYYQGIFQNAGITILILLLPWIAIRLGNKWYSKGICLSHISVIAGLLLFLVYRSLVHEVQIKNIVFNVGLFVLYFAALYGCINIRQFIITSSAIASVACVLVFVQTISYYLFHHHIQLSPSSLFSENASAWIMLSKTGLIGVSQRLESLYRPSAFFMEPSHMFLYTFPHLMLMILSPNINKYRVWMGALFSLGIILCTSGMGIVVTAGVWAMYFSMSSGKQNKLKLKNIFTPNNAFFIVLFLVFGIALVFMVPFVRDSIKRFVDTSNSGAIAGRIRLSNNLLKSLVGTKLLFGVTNSTAGISFNMPGFSATLYKFGIIGVVLAYWIYVYGVLKLKNAFFWISLTVVAVSFFSAQTHGAFYMIYYVFFILEGRNHLPGNKKQPFPMAQITK